MDVYILAKTILFLMLSVNNPTTLTFDEPIEFVQAGRTGEFSIVRLSHKKTIIIQPLIDNFETRVLVVATKSHQYVFKLKKGDENSRNALFMHEGKVNASFISKFENEHFRLMEGDTSVMVQKKTSATLILNGEEIRSTQFFSKGLPVFLNNVQVY